MSGTKERPLIFATYNIKAYSPDGQLKDEQEFTNIVPDVGLVSILQQYFKGSGYTAALYLGLTANDPVTDATDTMASHAGWTEVVAYEAATRPAISFNDAAANAIDNVGSEAQYIINANNTDLGGAFITDSPLKGGTTGLLVSVGAFDQLNKLLDDQDTITVAVTITAVSS